LVDDGLSDLRLAQETLEETRRLEQVRVDDLQRDDAADFESGRLADDLGAPHLAHAARAEFGVEAVGAEGHPRHEGREYRRRRTPQLVRESVRNACHVPAVGSDTTLTWCSESFGCSRSLSLMSPSSSSSFPATRSTRYSVWGWRCCRPA